MFTPQQIDEISFREAKFNGYNKHDVDETLEPLIEDYVTLYKENALLKSKMKVLVTKLEEYRRNEASMKDALVNAQRTCDKMVQEAEAKCAQMLNDANAVASQNTKNADVLIAAENARVEEAKKAAVAKIEALQQQVDSIVGILEQIKVANLPEPKPIVAFDYDREEGPARPSPEEQADAVAHEISASLQALVGTTEDVEPKAAPKHPVSDTTGKFANLRFGPNYDPTKR